MLNTQQFKDEDSFISVLESCFLKLKFLSYNYLVDN